MLGLALFAFGLLVGLPALTALAGLYYWLMVANVDVDKLLEVAHRLVGTDPQRLQKLSRAMPRSPILAVIDRALTLDPGDLREPEPPALGYRDGRPPFDRDARVRADLRAHGRALATAGRTLWWGSAAGVIPAARAFATIGPWSPWRVAALCWSALAVLVAFAAVSFARARVERKLERVIQAIAPHAGVLAQPPGR